MKTLEAVLVEWKSHVAALRLGDPACPRAASIERFIADVEEGAEPYLRWLVESDAMLQSGHAKKWFRVRYEDWEEMGLARRDRGRRYYRMMVVPFRANTTAAYEAGRRGARSHAA